MSSGFVSETELAEQRRRRQEEWEKVRTEDQPVEAPEEVYDPRSLFERLEEQRKKKDEEYEEAHKLKNMVRGLDDDEVEFLDTVERLKENIDKRVRDEERAEMEQFRSAVATLTEQNLAQRLEKEIQPAIIPASKKSPINRSSQQKLLVGAVIRKKNAENVKPAPKKMRPDPEALLEANRTPKGDNAENTSSTNLSGERDAGIPEQADREATGLESEAVAVPVPVAVPVAVLPSTMHCVAILPGMGSYPDSSDSEQSSDSDADQPRHRRYDLVGRIIEHGGSEGIHLPDKRKLDK